MGAHATVECNSVVTRNYFSNSCELSHPRAIGFIDNARYRLPYRKTLFPFIRAMKAE